MHQQTCTGTLARAHLDKHTCMSTLARENQQEHTCTKKLALHERPKLCCKVARWDGTHSAKNDALCDDQRGRCAKLETGCCFLEMPEQGAQYEVYTKCTSQGASNVHGTRCKEQGAHCMAQGTRKAQGARRKTALLCSQVQDCLVECETGALLCACQTMHSKQTVLSGHCLLSSLFQGKQHPFVICPFGSSTSDFE